MRHVGHLPRIAFRVFIKHLQEATKLSFRELYLLKKQTTSVKKAVGPNDDLKNKKEAKISS
jgi:hypothetical protein